MKEPNCIYPYYGQPLNAQSQDSGCQPFDAQREIDDLRARIATLEAQAARSAATPTHPCTHPFASLGRDGNGSVWCVACGAMPLVIEPAV